MILNARFLDFLPEIKQLAKQTSIQKNDLLTDSFLLEKEGSLSMYYAPHNEYMNTKAKVVIVGITPGLKQMQTAYNQMIQSLNNGDTIEQMLKNAKVSASFSGHMRKNLVDMLDQVGLADALDIQTTAQLFTTHRPFLHTTSVIKYPVFYKGKNYTGHTPAIDNSLMLKHYADHMFPEELNQLKTPALMIPLGKATEKVIHIVSQRNNEKKHTYLFGFPHPSGANGHRQSQFRQNQKHLQQMIRKWKKS